ncbi:MAG: hypothetical protein COB46_02055 [Rhodospirillaceae bacterium]|nr:MAG: hypothetical protein COB46_02055 [Rhodospirillaceae bacterium]
MIKINTDYSFADCEKLIELCGTSQSQNAELELATNIRLAQYPGGATSLAQALITWARRHESPRLVIYAGAKGGEATIRKFTDRLHGLVATMMASEVLATDRQTSVRKVAYSDARHRIENMNDGKLSETARGVGTSLICVDHSSMGYLRPLYHNAEVENRLRGESDFFDLTQKILNASVPQPHCKKITHQDTTAIAAILKELFSNTHDHARHDFNGRFYKKSVRGIHTVFHYVDPDRIDEVACGLPMLAAYLKQHINGWRGQHLQFLELSVFDSGPGLATRALQKPLVDLSLEEEISAVKRCFLKHVSSKERSTDGLGLYRTMGLLKNRLGYIRLRTGRLSLCKSFPPESGGSTETELLPEDLQLVDGTNGNDEPEEMPSVDGVVVTILLPIGRA